MTQNPLMAAIQLINAGRNPMAFLQNMARQDPQVSQFIRMIDGKSPQQLQSMAENMAKERGISINDVMRELGITNPSGR